MVKAFKKQQRKVTRILRESGQRRNYIASLLLFIIKTIAKSNLVDA